MATGNPALDKAVEDRNKANAPKTISTNQLQPAIFDSFGSSNTLQPQPGNLLTGPGPGQLDLYGTPEQQAGQKSGLQFGQLLYGQGIADVGKEAAEYGQMLKGQLGKEYAGSDLYRQELGQRSGKIAAQSGLSGTNMAATQEQMNRKASMDAAKMNQDYQNSMLALYGKNISAKQQGLASQYQAGAGIGQAQTPTPTPSYNSGISVICTELHHQGKISNTEWIRASAFGYKLHPNTYFGYLTIAEPIVKLMKKSDKFSNLFIGWAKSIAKHKPNLLTKALLPICFLVGYARRIKKEEIIRSFTR